MAAKYRKVDPRTWTDEKFRQLTTEGRILALWMLTSTRVNRCGIVMWSPGLASEETGIPATRIDTVCHTMQWIRDTVSNTVFLRRWWRYNKPDNVKALQGALSDLHDVPGHSLKSALLVAMQDLPAEWHAVYRSAVDTVCHTVSDTVSPQEQEQEQEQNNPPIAPQGASDKPATAYCQAFTDWWLAYPKKVGKEAAYKSWKKAGARIKAKMLCTSTEAAAFILTRTQAYATARAGEDSQFTPNPSTWLNQGRYDDDPATWKTAKAASRVQEIPTGGTPVFNAETGEIVLAKE